MKDTGSCFCLPNTWKVARDTLLKISGASTEIKINSSIFRHVRCSKFLVIAETQNYLTVEKLLPTLDPCVILKPIKNEPVRTFSIYSLRLFHVFRFKNSSTKNASSLDAQHHHDREEEDNMAQNKKPKMQKIHEQELDYTHNSRLDEEEDKVESPKKAHFTTLQKLKKSLSEVLKICFILPFTDTGKIPVEPDSWDETFQLKWSLLERIFNEYHWRDIFSKLPVPLSSKKKINRALTFKQIQESLNLPKKNHKIFISIALKSHYGGCTEVAVLDKNGVVRLHSLLDLTQKVEFWEMFQGISEIFPIERKAKKFTLIVPNKMLLKNILLMPPSVEMAYEFIELVPGSDLEEERNEAFFRSIWSIKKDHTYFQHLDLESIISLVFLSLTT